MKAVGGVGGGGATPNAGGVRADRGGHRGGGNVGVRIDVHRAQVRANAPVRQTDQLDQPVCSDERLAKNVQYRGHPIIGGDRAGIGPVGTVQPARDIEVPLPHQGIEGRGADEDSAGRGLAPAGVDDEIAGGDVLSHGLRHGSLANDAVLVDQDHVPAQAAEDRGFAAPAFQVEPSGVGFPFPCQYEQRLIDREELAVDFLAERQGLVA